MFRGVEFARARFAAARCHQGRANSRRLDGLSLLTTTGVANRTQRPSRDVRCVRYEPNERYELNEQNRIALIECVGDDESVRTA